jgi:transposase-like protein
MTREQARAITGKNRQVIAKAFGLDEDKVAQAMHKFRPGAPMMPPPPGVDGACDSDHGRPVEAVARELGVTPQQFREAFKNVMPAPRGEEPTDEQRLRNRQVLAKALGVDPEKLDAVMDKYRPEGPNQRPPRPAPPAEKQGDAPSESGY